MNLVKVMGSVDREGIKTIVKAGADLWERYGYTTATEGRATKGTAKVMKEVAAEGGFQIDVVSHMEVNPSPSGPRPEEEERPRRSSLLNFATEGSLFGANRGSRCSAG